jgi:hypothetical protein
LFKLNGPCVIYTGERNAGTNINPGDSFNTVVSKLITAIGQGGGGLYNANSGLYNSSNTFQLGQPYSTAGNPAKLLNNSEIPTDGKNLAITGAGNLIVGGTTSQADNGNGLQVRRSVQTDTLIGPRNRVVIADINGVLQTINEITNGIFYVERRYVGNGAAIITGLTQNDIASVNMTYIDQLAQARQGDINNPYPDPWAARNAALDAISDGIINRATIVVSGNDFWTVGSDVNTNNGDLEGNATGHLVADIGFSLTNSTIIASLAQNNLTYFFNPVTVIYISATYRIPISYISDVNDAIFVSKIYGFLNVTQIYGEVNGFLSLLMYIDNARSQVVMEFGELILQQSNVSVNIINAKIFTLTANNVILPDSIFANIGAGTSTSRNGDGDDSIININVNFIQKSSPAFPYPVSDDFWYLFTLDRMEQARTKNISVNINTIFIEGSTETSLFRGRTSQGNYKDVNYALNIHNLHFKIDPAKTITADGLIGGALVNVETYVNLSINIDNVVTEASLINTFTSSGGGKAVITVDIDNALRVASTETSYGMFTFVGSFDNPSPATFIIKGFYANENTNAASVNIFTNSTFPINEKIVLSGIFKQTGAQPVVSIQENGAQTAYLYLMFNDIVLVNDGTVNSVESTNKNYALYFKDTHINSPINTHLVVLGEQPVLEANLINYI